MYNESMKRRNFLTSIPLLGFLGKKETKPASHFKGICTGISLPIPPPTPNFTGPVRGIYVDDDFEQWNCVGQFENGKLKLVYFTDSDLTIDLS